MIHEGLKMFGISNKKNQENENRLNEEVINLTQKVDNLLKEEKNIPQINENIEEISSEITELKNELASVKNENAELKKIIEDNKKSYDRILDSYNQQFSTLFLYYDLKSKGPLRNFQRLNQELLNFVVHVLEKYNLSYWLDYGTLLGAVRHGGYIPWDDDIDLGMMRKDYNKFIEVIGDELESHNLGNVEVTVNDRLEAIRISFLQIAHYSDEGELLAGLDIFPSDYVDTPERGFAEKVIEEQKVFIEKMKEGEDINEYLADYYQRFNLSMDEQNYIVSGIDNNLRGNSGYHAYHLGLFKKEVVFPLKTIKFNGISYPCPNDYDFYLRDLYRDYNKIPKVVVHHFRADNLNRKYDDEFFDNEIRKFAEINKNFNK